MKDEDGNEPPLVLPPTPAGGTLFGLIRHAPTLWNDQKRIQGKGDSPLTEKGIGRARRWGELLKPLDWETIVTSDQGRSRHTAELVNQALNLPLVQEPRLREQNWGDWEGLALETILREKSEELAQRLAAGWGFRPPGGESREEVWQRGCQALTDMAGALPGRKVLVITHGGMIRALTYRLIDRHFDPAEPALVEKRHLHLIAAGNGGLHLNRINALRLP